MALGLVIWERGSRTFTIPDRGTRTKGLACAEIARRALRWYRRACHRRRAASVGLRPDCRGLHLPAGFAMMMKVENSEEDRIRMLNTRDAMQVLDHDFLDARARLLEVAAILDRIERAPARHGEHPDVRLYQIRRAVEALLEPGPGRAETIQRIFSLEYDSGWRERLNVARVNAHVS